MSTSCFPSLGETCGNCHRCAEPEPVECPRCEGTGNVIGGRFLSVKCHCNNGVIEP